MIQDSLKIKGKLSVEHFDENKNLIEQRNVNNLVVDGNDKFSIIKNIPDVEIDGKKLLIILTEDLVKLLG
jgi:hypothetical protein